MRLALCSAMMQEFHHLVNKTCTFCSHSCLHQCNDAPLWSQLIFITSLFLSIVLVWITSDSDNSKRSDGLSTAISYIYSMLLVIIIVVDYQYCTKSTNSHPKNLNLSIQKVTPADDSTSITRPQYQCKNYLPLYRYHFCTLICCCNCCCNACIRFPFIHNKICIHCCCHKEFDIRKLILFKGLFYGICILGPSDASISNMIVGVIIWHVYFLHLIYYIQSMKKEKLRLNGTDKNNNNINMRKTTISYDCIIFFSRFIVVAFAAFMIVVAIAALAVAGKIHILNFRSAGAAASAVLGAIILLLTSYDCCTWGLVLSKFSYVDANDMDLLIQNSKNTNCKMSSKNAMVVSDLALLNYWQQSKNLANFYNQINYQNGKYESQLLAMSTLRTVDGGDEFDMPLLASFEVELQANINFKGQNNINHRVTPQPSQDVANDIDKNLKTRFPYNNVNIINDIKNKGNVNSGNSTPNSNFSTRLSPNNSNSNSNIQRSPITQFSPMGDENVNDFNHNSRVVKYSTKLDSFVEQRCLHRYSISITTLVVVINATLTIIISAGLLVLTQTVGSDSDNGTDKCFHPEHPLLDPWFPIDKECSVALVSISIGLLILFITFFGIIIDHCLCFRENSCCKDYYHQSSQSVVVTTTKVNDNNGQKRNETMGTIGSYSDTEMGLDINNNNGDESVYNNSKCFYCVYGLRDNQTRGTIMIKFIYFMLKPALIAIATEVAENNKSDLNNIISVAFEILMFITVTIIAYLTFNRDYNLLSLIAIVYNSQLLARTYLITFIIANVASYSILCIVVLFAWNNDMDRYNWTRVIYPQCGWLLLIKLYHNQISQIICLLERPNKEYVFNYQLSATDNDDDDDNNNYNYSYNYNFNQNFVGNSNGNETSLYMQHNLDLIKVNHEIFEYTTKNVFKLLRSLLVWQFSVWLAAIYAIVVYGYYGFCENDILKDGYQYSDGEIWYKLVWYWQLLLPIGIVFVMPVAIASSKIEL